MKSKSLILTLVACFLFGFTSSAAEIVRLATWNLEWFPGKKPTASQEERDKHFMEVAAVLPQMRADIIVLQEVRNDEAAQRIAKLMPGFSVHVTSRFLDSFTHKLGDQQITILSRLRLILRGLSHGRGVGPGLLVAMHTRSC